MAFMKYAYAQTTQPSVSGRKWFSVRRASGRTSGNLVEQASEILGEPFNPDNYLLTHCTAVCSVDLEPFSDPNMKLGKVRDPSTGKQINRKFAEFRVQPECDQFINNNCFVPGTLITMADGTVKRIEEVQEGDEVLTHLGRTKRVTATMRRDVAEELVEVKPRGTSERLYSTNEHPFFVFRENLCANCGLLSRRNTSWNNRCISHLLGKFYCSRQCYYEKKTPKKELLAEKRGEFVEAAELTLRDFTATPVLKGVKDVGLTLGQARLIGLFLAEGYYELWSRNDNERVGAIWAFHAEEAPTLARTVCELMKQEFGVECAVRAHSQDNGIDVTTRTNREAVAFFSKWVHGDSSKTKTLHPLLLHASEEVQLEIVRGWFEGDGCLQDTRTEKVAGDIRLTGSTANRSLASQMQIILHRLGVSSHLTRGKSVARKRLVIDGETKIVSDPERPPNVRWSVACGGTWIEDLVRDTVYEEQYFAAVERRGGLQAAVSLRFLNGFHLQIVEALDKVAYAGPVFNFDVEDDHSYIANGVAVHNCDAWSRPVLMKSYRTFVGGHNFCEHVQRLEESKGRILDAVARDIGKSVYIDLLIATHRRHAALVRDIESGKMTTLSMGCSVVETTCTKCGNVAADETEMCFPPGTRVLLAEGRYVPIEEVVVGDVVLTHTGESHAVTETMSHPHHGDLVSLDVEGVPVALRSTPNHPYWVLRPARVCGCGCGQSLRRTVEHERGAAKAFRRFLPGHNTRLRNPNQHVNNVVALADYERLFDVDLEFVEAAELQKGDYLAFPVPQGSENTDDATINRARLIGYFLAEGSFTKRDGKRVGVEFTFGHHEYDTLAAEVQDLLDAEFGRDERREDKRDWQWLVAAGGDTPHLREQDGWLPDDGSARSTCSAPSEYVYNARFKKGHDDCYQCKVCQRQWVQSADRSLKARRYRRLIEGDNTGSVAVRLISEEAAEFFYRYCGEYSNEKRLDPEVLWWAPEIQKHVLFGWLGGDAVQSDVGITGNTASFHLLSQMHIIAARCGLYSYKKATFAGRTASFDQVVNGDGSVTARDHRGWLPSFGLVISDPQGFSEEVRFSDRENVRVTMSAVTDGFKRVGNWLLYRIRGIECESYCGMVHNLEVEQDHSYVVEGVAAHNCDHIKYEKGNYFYDNRGGRHRIAELCGHESLEPNAGVNFIEESWVATPAFGGAVLRNILTPTGIKPEMLVQAQKVLSQVPQQWVSNGASKEANYFAPDGPGPVFSDPGRTSFDFEDEDEGEGEGDEKAPSSEKSESKPFDQLENDIYQMVLDRVNRRVDDDLKGRNEQPSTQEPQHSTGEDIIKQGRARHYAIGLAAIVKSASSDAHLMDSVARFNVVNGVEVPRSLYVAALDLGPLRKYGSVEEWAVAAHASLNRTPSLGETKTLLRLGKLLDQMAANQH